MSDLDDTRQSWNIATKNHNAHKGDQAAFIRSGKDTLFQEELELLGPLEGRRLVHLQCNAGQDTLCLARRGARATGVDLSDEAVRFARRLSADTGIEASFVEGDVATWMRETSARFELAFSSYGAAGWLPGLDAWASGIYRVLTPGGRFVYVEFHPLVWSLGPDLRLTGDDYFAKTPFVEPVGDYVAESGEGLGVVTKGATEPNTVPAPSWQHTLADVVSALLRAGLHLETLREYPYANGCKLNPSLVMDDQRRWTWPEGTAKVPLMFAVAARRPARETT